MRLPSLFDIRSKVSPSGIVSPPGNLGRSGGLRAHFWAILFFVAVAWGWAAVSWNKGVEHIKQSDTTSLYYEVVNNYKPERETLVSSQKTEWTWPALLPQILADQRAVYAKTDINLLYHAAFERYFGTIYRVTGDVSLGYKILVFPLNLLFLLGAYALFFRLTEKPVLSAFLAFLASFPIAIPIAGEYFGMGPVTIYSRRNFFTAFAPFAIYLFYRWIQNPRLLIVAFAFIGLISNLHSSGILLAEILILTYLLYQDKTVRSLGYSALFGAVAAIFGFVSIGGLWGTVESFFYSFLELIVPSAYAAMPGFMQKEGIPEGVQFLFYPLRIYSHLPDGLFHAMTLAVTVILLAVLFFRNRINPHVQAPVLFMSAFVALAYLGFSEFKYILLMGVAVFALSWRQLPDAKFILTHYLILVIFVVSFIGMLLFQAGFYLIDGFPLIFNQLRGTRFLGLIVFVWLAVLISRIDWKNSGIWNKRLFIVFSVIALFMLLRQEFRSYIRYKVDPAIIEILDVARWSKKHTPQDSAFLVVSTRFGIVAERRIFLHDRDSRTSWGQNLVERMRGGLPAQKQLAREKGMSYIVVKKDNGKLPAGTIPVYDNQRYALVKVD